MAAPQIRLRPPAREDQDRLLAWRNSPAVAAYMFTDHLITPAEHARWFEGLAGDAGRADWIIEADARPAGLASLYDIDRESMSCASASYLAEPSLRGRGIGGYVEQLLIERAFGVLGLGRIWCEVLATNTPGLRMHEKFGYREAAGPRRRTPKAGALVDVVRLELEAAEWARLRPGVRRALHAAGFDVG
jgi:UDP-4-amino-4,6-dideoxy-N-acetyl-beta-L-altrosamine N-acetyltransferase